MNKNLKYAFRVYYIDGTNKVLSSRAVRPEELYNDFDMLMPFEEYEKLHSQNLQVGEILVMASKLYKNFLQKDFNRLEIINVDTNDVIDFIDC